MSIVPPDLDSNKSDPPCTTMGCPAIGTIPGVYSDDGYSARATYCAECAAPLIFDGSFEPDAPAAPRGDV